MIQTLNSPGPCLYPSVFFTGNSYYFGFPEASCRNIPAPYPRFSKPLIVQIITLNPALQRSRKAVKELHDNRARLNMRRSMSSSESREIDLSGRPLMSYDMISGNDFVLEAYAVPISSTL
jgi:hypothetical protein